MSRRRKFAPSAAHVGPGNCKNIVYIANVNNVTQGNINIKDAS